MAKKLISIDDSAPVGSRLPAPVRAEMSTLFPKINVGTLGILGDSNTQNGLSYGASSLNKNTRGFWVPFLSNIGDRLQLVAQGGVAGDNTTQMLARLDPYLARRAYWNIVMAGTNDALQDVAAATMKTNLTAIWDRIEANGGRVVAVTIPPNTSGTTAQKNKIREVNNWILRQARTRPGLIVVDAYALLSDATGVYAGNMSNDGIHLTGTAAWILGRAIAAAITPLIATVPGVLPLPGDTASMVLNTSMAGTGGTINAGGTGTVATSWTANPIGTSVFSVAQRARTDGVAGNWQDITVTSGGCEFLQNIAAGGGWAVGDKVYAVAEVILGSSLAPVGATEYVRLKHAGRTGSSDTFAAYDYALMEGHPVAGYSYPATPIVLSSLPWTIPAGVDTVRCAVQSATPGTFSLGRFGFYKVGTGPLYDTDYSLYLAV